jgi:hypothetical protein
MNLKALARKVLLLFLLGSCGLIVCGHLFPIYSKPSPPTVVSLWQTCETLAGARRCFSKYVESSSQCSEMDSRISMMTTFSVIWFVNNLQMCLVLVWELLDKTVPISNLQLMMFAWSGGSGSIVVGLVTHTLVANLCDSPLTFNEQGGQYEQGGMFLTISLGVTIVGFLFYFVAPEDDEEEVMPIPTGKTGPEGASKDQKRK